MKIEIYSTPTCHYCHLSKDLLTSLNVPYVDYNVLQEREKLQELQSLGIQGVPFIRVTHADGKVETMNGFEEERLRALAK